LVFHSNEEDNDPFNGILAYKTELIFNVDHMIHVASINCFILNSVKYSHFVMITLAFE